MTSFPLRKLGKNGPEVSAIGFGGMGLSVAYGAPKPDAERFAALSATVAAGSTLIDTADIYGDNEVLIGKWLKANPGMREKIFLATKFGIEFSSDRSTMCSNGTPEYVEKQLRASLEKLQVDTIDLYYVHRIDKTVPIETTVKALAEHVKAGRIRYIGLSECSADTLRRAHAVHPISAIQVEYSPFSLDIETAEIGLLKVARELGVAIVAYSPLGRGILTGTIRSPSDFGPGDFRLYAPRFSEENFPKNLELVDRIAAMAKEKGITASQLTLAWIMAQGEDFIPIPGTTSVARVKENAEAAAIKLTAEEVQAIRKAAQECVVPGQPRYPAGMDDTLYSDSAPL